MVAEKDLPSGADGCVTSLSCDPMGKSLLLAGCSDGSVRLFDRRLPPSDWSVTIIIINISMLPKLLLIIDIVVYMLQYCANHARAQQLGAQGVFRPEQPRQVYYWQVGN